MQSFPMSCWIPKFNRRNFVDVKVMLSLSIKNLWTLLRTASQSWLRFVLFTWNLVFQSSANYVLYKRSKILHYSICGALQVYLDVWQSAIMCHQVGFLLKVRSKLDSVFSLYQSQTQSTMPDLVKNGDLFFSTFYLWSQKSVCYSMKRACQREKAPSFKPLQLNFTIEVRAYCIFLTLHLCHLIKSFDFSWKRNWKHSSWSLFFKFYWVKCLLH